MAELIKNGNFAQGFLHWDNGVGGEPFALDSGMARAKSSGEHTNDVDYRIRQSFAINDEAVSGKLTVYGAYRSYAGDKDGQVSFRVQIQKPDSSWYTALDLLDKTAHSGGYNILDGADIIAALNQQGNYKLQLQCLVETSSKDGHVSNDYNNWNNSGFTLYDGNSKIEKKVDDDIKTATIYKDFDLNGEDSLATLTVSTEAIINDGNGYVKLWVKLKDPDGNWHTLASVNKTATQTWWYILFSEDISNYITKDGTYRLQLEAKVKSTQAGVYNYGRFGHIGLTRYDYSNGWYDNISMDVVVKKKKSVIESIGTDESTGSEIQHKPKKEVSESLGLAGSFLRTVKKYISESLSLSESHSYKVMKFFGAIAESISLSESYTTVRKKLSTVSESLGLSEAISAKKTSGNVETAYTPGTPTQWSDVDKVTTAWIKSKTVIDYMED